MENENSIKKSKSKKYLTIILIIIGLTLAFIGGYLLSNMKNDKNNNEQKENEEDIKKAREEQLKRKKDDYLNRKEDMSNIVNDQEVKDKLLEIENELSNLNNDLEPLDVDNELVLDLFDIYHAISNNSKEELAFYQFNSDDFIDVSCDFFKLPDSIIDHVGEVEPYYCGEFTDEIEKAWNNGDASLVLDLIHKNKTKAIKEETLRNKLKELFGSDIINDSEIILSPEYKNPNWWSNIFGFIFVEKVEGKDYYVLTFGSGGDPADRHNYYIKEAYKADDKIYIVYEMLSDSEPMYYDLNMLILKNDYDDHYVFDDDKLYLHKLYSRFN